uniref:BED-type domain-containing protein n=1 Tax=Anopheles atroparvus TaxID=41427 RepID=A0AAG5DQN4_ANOAO
MAELTSEVWQHFTKSYDGATCRYCSVVMAYPGGSTSNLKRHLNRRHPTVPPPTSNNVSCAFGRNAPPSYEISKRTQDTNTTLKPWTHETSTKSNQCRLQMLRKKALIDLFKCMETSCAFTTNDGMEMEHHLLGHDPPKEVESCTLSCAYCTTATTTPRALVNHIRENHGQCRFQCLFCFYRALEAGNVLYHQHYHHSAVQNVTSTIVELPSTERQPKTDYLIGMCTSFQSNHELLTCTVCHTTHASISLFKEHVYQHRESAIKCPICSIQILKEDALDHLNHHRTCFRKCLYCKTTCKSKLLMYRHLSDCHLNKAMFYALKMQRFDKPYDIFVLENLGFDVPPSRILLATYVTGGVLLTPKLTPDTFKKTRNKHTVVKRVEQTDLPKIVKVQGGIVFSEDGSILQATDSVQTQSSEPDKVISETRDVGNAVSTPSIRLHASDRADSIYSPISSNLPKTVTASVDTETDAVETQPPVNADKNMAEAVAKSNIVKPIMVEVNNLKKSATSKTNVIVAGLPKKATLSTVTSVRVVPTSKVRTAALEYSDTGAVSIAANNVANVVSPSVNIASVATHSDRAPNLDIQPPLVCNSDSDNTGKVISTKNFINTQHFESMIKTNSQVVLNRSKIVVKNFNSLSASTATGPSIGATIPSVTRNTDCAVSVSVVGADASELKHGAASIIVKETNTDSARNSAEGSGTMRTKHIDINVKDFRSKTSVSLPVPNGNRNPSVSRTCVKLTRLEDGSLVLKFPSKSNPTTKPPGNADMARIVSKSDVVQPVISGGNKVKPFATLVPVADFTKKMPPTTHNAFVHARSASIRHSKDEQKKTDDTAGCEISPTQTIESNQTISKKQTTSASAIGLRKLSVLPEFACQSSNASILKPAQTSTKPTSSATQIKGNVVKIDMVLKDLPTWNRYGIDLNSLELKNLLSHWPFLADRIDIFYRSLKWAVSRNKIKEVDCFVCGVKDCHNCFQTISSLKAHMVKNHFVLKTAAIACKHCDCLLCGIDAYVTHVNMHIMCRFVCFMCNHNHFLLNKMVDHMKKEHKCKVAMLSFVHPQHVNPLKDLIILM